MGGGGGGGGGELRDVGGGIKGARVGGGRGREREEEGEGRGRRKELRGDGEMEGGGKEVRVKKRGGRQIGRRNGKCH